MAANNTAADAVVPSIRNQELEAYLASMNVLRANVAQVVSGLKTGLLVTGPGGTGKSYTILDELKRLDADYALSNSRMTGRALFETLQRAPKTLHLLEDMETLLKDKNALGVLRGALWGQGETDETGRQKRFVTWSTAKKHERLLFTGGIILVLNGSVNDSPELGAIATRIGEIRIEPSNEELAEVMRDYAQAGHTHGSQVMSGEECQEVVEFLIGEAARRDLRLDLRVMRRAFSHYLHGRDGDSGVGWQTLVETDLAGRPARAGKRLTRKQQKEVYLSLVAELYGRDLSTRERIAAWAQTTGKSRAVFYRHAGELGLTRNRMVAAAAE